MAFDLVLLFTLATIFVIEVDHCNPGKWQEQYLKYISKHDI